LKHEAQLAVRKAFHAGCQSRAHQGSLGEVMVEILVDDAGGRVGETNVEVARIYHVHNLDRTDRQDKGSQHADCRRLRPGRAPLPKG
jgi:hypothetical protein